MITQKRKKKDLKKFLLLKEFEVILKGFSNSQSTLVVVLYWVTLAANKDKCQCDNKA